MEEDLPQLPYLNAIFHETIRRHSPVPIVPPRYAHEETQLGGYDIPASTEVSILCNTKLLTLTLTLLVAKIELNGQTGYVLEPTISRRE